MDEFNPVEVAENTLFDWQVQRNADGMDEELKFHILYHENKTETGEARDWTITPKDASINIGVNVMFGHHNGTLFLDVRLISDVKVIRTSMTDEPPKQWNFSHSRQSGVPIAFHQACEELLADSPRMSAANREIFSLFRNITLGIIEAYFEIRKTVVASADLSRARRSILDRTPNKNFGFLFPGRI